MKRESPDSQAPADEDTERPQDTVGAICLDQFGCLAAGSSSGGILLKAPGRVGPAGTPFAGCWAQRSAACCATGCGEGLMRGLASWRCVHDLLLNTFFEPQKRTVRGVQHLIIGLNSGHHGIKEIRNLQNFLMDAWRNSLVLSVEDAAPYRRERDRVVSKEGAPSKDPEQAAGEDSQESSAGEQVRPPKATQNGVAKSNMQRLAEAKEAMELGLISVEEYETKKAEIMAQM